MDLALIRTLAARTDELRRELATEPETFDAEGCRGVEARRAANPSAALRLVRLMSDLSESHYCAGWLHHLEYTLWGMILGESRDFGMGPLSVANVLGLIELAVAADGWWRWSDTAVTEVFVPIAEWQSIWELWLASGRPAAFQPPESRG